MSDEIDLAARHLVAMAELDDAVFTEVLKLLVVRTAGVLVGLDHRIKTLESLRRKLADLLSLDPDLTLDEAAPTVYDVLRFTVVADPEDYMSVHDEVLDGLQQQAATVVEQRNRWKGPGYRGINARLRVGETQRFEIQFHTRASYEAAKATRGQYEELRLADTPPDRAEALRTAIDSVFAEVQVPPGAVK